MVRSSEPVVVRADGLWLREWEDRDLAHMVAMFNTDDVDRWTPLAHPFDDSAAAAYLERARQRRTEGALQLAITEDGGEPLGEVLLFPTEVQALCELGYIVGAQHRGRALAARAVRALLPRARADGYRAARLRVAVDNHPSLRVARVAGFEPTDEPPVREERKGYVLDIATWARSIP